MKLTADKIEPSGYNVLVEIKVVDEKSAGGIVLTQSVQNREQAAMTVGKILKFGPICYRGHASGINSPEEWGVKVGDNVQFPSHTYMRVAGEKSNLVFVLDYDIKAKVDIDG